MQQTNRSKKSNRKKMRRRHSMTGGAPLAPIYEHEGSTMCSPQQDYMSGNNFKKNNHKEEVSESSGDESVSTIQAESQFQIITDNSSSYSEFISSNLKPSSSKSLGEGRWENGDATQICKDSNSSINTNSTSSLTVSIYEVEDYGVDDFFEDAEKMSSTEIIQQATDVVAGKYEYNTGGNLNPRTTTRHRQARRSSLPTMPIRQESIQLIDVASEVPPSMSSAESTPAVDKFGIPNRPSSGSSHGRRRRKERRSSLPISSDASPKDSMYGYSEASPSAKVDEFGIPTSRTSSHSRRRRQGRRSSMGDTPSKPFEQPKQPLVDKYGIPISSNPPLESRSAHTHTSRMRRRRQARRSSLGDSPSVPFEAQGFETHDGITITPLKQPLDSSSSHSTRERRISRSERRSSDPTSATLVDKFGIPVPSALSTNYPSKRRQGRRSSMPNRSVSFDLPPSSSSDEEKKEDSFHLRSSVSIAVDEFGIPELPRDFGCTNSGSQRRRQGRRSSMPTSPTSENSSILSSSKHNRSMRRGRRPSIPTHSPSARRFSPEELPIPNRMRANSGDKNGPTANGAPIRPERVPSTDNCGGQNPKIVPMAQPNASFGVVKQPHKKTSNKLESIASETLDDVLGKSENHGLASDVSVNSMQQKDGEWWW